MLFLYWAVVLTEGLGWLPAAQRSGLDHIHRLAGRTLGKPGAGGGHRCPVAGPARVAPRWG